MVVKYCEGKAGAPQRGGLPVRVSTTASGGAPAVCMGGGKTGKTAKSPAMPLRRE